MGGEADIIERQGGAGRDANGDDHLRAHIIPSDRKINHRTESTRAIITISVRTHTIVILLLLLQLLLLLLAYDAARG